MSHKVYNLFNKRETPQSEPVPGKNQAENNAGGYGWKLDPWGSLSRLLILGTEGGTYYVKEQKLTRDNAANALLCLSLDYQRFVDTVVDISANGRAYKNDPALFCLALAASSTDDNARAYALQVLPRVARTGTHLFHFVEYANGMRGWGRSLRHAISRWYLERSEESLSYQLAKYQNRDGWSHRDLLRLAHVNPNSPSSQLLLRWAAGKEVSLEQLSGLVQTFERLKSAQSEEEVIQLIHTYGAQREVIPTQYLTSPRVWEALFPSMGLTALIRNLGNLSKIGWLVKNSSAEKEVIQRITDRDALRKARIHPLQILAALLTYSSGHGARGHGEWTPCSSIVNALNEAFTLTFENIIPTGKRIYLALDVSGSMSFSEISGIPGLTPRDASAALAMITLRTENRVMIKAFQNELIKLNITPEMSLEKVRSTISNLPFGPTDCARPMLDALAHHLEVDAFVIYTDSETWAGKIHPYQALQNYREKMNIPAKLIVVGMTSNGFTIADPSDSGMLDVVGFSTSTPSAISDFIADRLGQGTPAEEE